MKALQLTKDLFYVGMQDPGLRIFDIVMYTEFGTSYNSFLLKGSEKTALFETSKIKFYDAYLEKVKELVNIEDIDYIIVSHTEPDHSGSIEKILDLNPSIKIVGSSAAINFLKEICNKDFTSVVVKDGDVLSLGNKTLKFISAPNLHWPDTIFTYIEEEKALVTCDCFGAHYASESITSDKVPCFEDYMAAVEYYFDGIVGPFKSFALDAIKKIEDLDIELICTGHGPVINKDPWLVVNLYKGWSTEVNPNLKKTVVIPYVSAYGYTQELAAKITEGIKAAGDLEVKLFDMVTEDEQTVLRELYWADGILLGTPTFVGEALKPIYDIAIAMIAKTHGGKIASAFGSYGWSGEGVPHLIERLKQLNMKVFQEGYRARLKPSEAQKQGAYEFGFNFAKSVLAGKILSPEELDAKPKVWKCLVCGELVPGAAPPAACPVCGVGPEHFVAVDAEMAAFKSDDKRRIIIVGNGAAGTAAAEAARSRNAVCEIELISSEDVAGYNRPMLTKGILSDIEKLNFFIKPDAWYQENAIKMTLGVNVSAIDAAGKKLSLSNGETRIYDKLIFATGAASAVPAIKGSNLPGVFVIRTLADVARVQKALKSTSKIVILGGGILGLEAAWELKKAKKEVTVVDRSSIIMNRQLDANGSEILEKAIKNSGIVFVHNATIEAIVGDSKVTGVAIAGENLLDADMVIISMGNKPNTELAEAQGIDIDGSIVVNEKMETSKTDIYACGDCATYQGINYGIWNQAIAMGKVAGANAVGDDVVYQPVTPMNSFNGMGTSLFAVGDNGKDPDKKYKSFELFDQAKNTYEKMYFVNDRFCGGILMGDVKKAVKYSKAFEKQESIDKMLTL